MNPARTRRGLLLLCILIATVAITVVPALAETDAGDTITNTSADAQDTPVQTSVSAETTATGTAATGTAADTGTVPADDIPPYNGPLGPDSALYGLKLAFEDLDESFTFDPSARLDKQVSRATLRISEAKRELLRNNSQVAALALEQYYARANATEQSISAVPQNATGLLNAQEMIAKHQYVLENLLSTQQNNTGLQRAYANSVALELKFQNKTQLKVERKVQNNETVLTARPMTADERVRAETETGRVTGNTERVRSENEAQVRNQTGTGPATPAVQGGKPDTSQAGTGSGKGTGNVSQPAVGKTSQGQNAGAGSSAGNNAPSVTKAPSKTSTPTPDTNGAGTAGRQNANGNSGTGQQGNGNKK